MPWFNSFKNIAYMMGFGRFMGFVSWMGWDGKDGWTGHASSAVTTTRSPAVQKSRTRFSKKKTGELQKYFWACMSSGG